MNRSITKRTIPAALLAVLLLLPGLAQAIEIRKFSLANGLEVRFVERRELPIVTVTALVKASPVGEEPEKAGIASLTAKMLTEGTATRTGPGISEEIEFIGGSLGAAANHDYTTVSLSVLRKDAEKGLDLLADVLTRASFPEAELARKKALVTGSLKQREEDPAFVAGRAFAGKVFGVNHPYGRIVEGSAGSIAAIGLDDMVSFYEKFYNPGNTVLTIVGDLREKEAKALADRYFRGWKHGSRTDRQAALPALPERSAPKIEVIDKSVTQATIYFGHPGISRSDPDYYAVSVMNYILGGGGFASRLMKTVRDDMGLTYSIYSFFMPQKYQGRFEIEVQTKNESADKVVNEILKQVRLIKSDLVSDRELADAKAFLTGSFPRRLETGRKIAEFLTAVEFYGLGDDYIEKYKDYISAVTREDVLRVAQKYLDDRNYVLVIVGDKSKLPSDIVRN